MCKKFSSGIYHKKNFYEIKVFECKPFSPLNTGYSTIIDWFLLDTEISFCQDASKLDFAYISLVTL